MSVVTLGLPLGQPQFAALEFGDCTVKVTLLSVKHSMTSRLPFVSKLGYDMNPP